MDYVYLQWLRGPHIRGPFYGENLRREEKFHLIDYFLKLPQVIYIATSTYKETETVVRSQLCTFNSFTVSFSWEKLSKVHFLG